ncbi:MAG: GatB/YqeY domain-containing protein, partial [Chloroflexota bacterium]|nr:GatB/YqeY domain-containing protein [Chloroflexota bacterium]
DSIEAYRAAGRDDRTAQESAELAVLEEYLPQLMGRDEVEAAARAVIAELGATGPGDKGKVMGRLMGQLKGKADGGLVNATVTELLQA